MDTSPFYVPQSIAPILERGEAQQIPLIAGNRGMSPALAALGNVAQAGFNVAAQNKLKQTLLGARQRYSDFLSKVQTGTATQSDYAQANMDAMAMGIPPLDPRKNALIDSTIKKNAAQAKLDDSNANKQPRTTSDQNLTPQEMNALRMGATRKNNPLPVSLVAYRGPRAKIIAQSLMQDPNWSPTAGESALAGARAGASAAAHLQQGGSAQMTARTANSANAQLDILSEISKKFPRSNVQFMNTPIIKFDVQTMPEAQNWIIALNSFRNEYASALMRGNMPQEKALDEVAKALPYNITPAQLTQAIPLLRLELGALVKGQMTPVTGQNQNNPHPQDYQAVQWAKSHPNDPRAAKILQLNAQ